VEAREYISSCHKSHHSPPPSPFYSFFCSSLLSVCGLQIFAYVSITRPVIYFIFGLAYEFCLENSFTWTADCHWHLICKGGSYKSVKECGWREARTHFIAYLWGQSTTPNDSLQFLIAQAANALKPKHEFCVRFTKKKLLEKVTGEGTRL